MLHLRLANSSLYGKENAFHSDIFVNGSFPLSAHSFICREMIEGSFAAEDIHQRGGFPGRGAALHRAREFAITGQAAAYIRDTPRQQGCHSRDGVMEPLRRRVSNSNST